MSGSEYSQRVIERFRDRGGQSGAHLLWRLAGGVVSLVLSGVPTIVLAQSVDCTRIKSTTVPVELVVTFGKYEQAYQIYMDAGKSAVIWTRQTMPLGVSMSRVQTINGFGIASSLTSTVDNVPDRESQMRYSGIVIEDDDHRHKVSYRVSWTFRYRNGSTRQVQQDIDYSFVSAGEATIGSCTFAVYRAETSYTGFGSGETIRMFQTYFPEFRIAVTSSTPEVVFVSLKTSFEPFHLLR